ncbi:hypothetical protein AYO38_02495 [bacterium SCGC AG-212-C10]|nr:hypothetical protein AYO38_02495 [bacterium SCGC AG-212-C10]
MRKPHLAQSILYIASLAATLLAVATVMAACDEDEPPAALEPGPWLAIGPGLIGTNDAVSPTRALNLATGNELTFGPAGTYPAVAWSPDGKRLAAIDVNLEKDDGGLRVHVWDTAGNSLSSEAIDPYFGQLAWSPDSRRLAVTGGKGIAMFDVNGKQLGTVWATPTADGSVQTSSGPAGVSIWSPGSEFVATLQNDLVLVADRNGKGGERDLPAIDRGSGENRLSISLNGWDAPNQLRLFLQNRDGATIRHGLVSHDAIDWQDDAQPVDFATFYRLEGERAAVESLGTGLRISAGDLSADGSASLWVLQPMRPTDGLNVETKLVARLPERTIMINVDPMQWIPSYSERFDLVVVPGFKGALPETVSVAGANASQSPTRVPPIAPPEPTYSGQPDASLTPVAYPSPKGEHVQPRVAGLPVFPGAREIDGFESTVDGATVATQQFETDASQADVLAFFEQQLADQGYRSAGGGHGVAGTRVNYIRGRDRVLVSTQFIPRPEDVQPSGATQYGFQGKGVPFLEGANGKRWFWIVSIHAD